MAEIAVELDFVNQSFKGHILMGIRSECHLLHGLDQLSEGHVAMEINSHHQRINKAADQFFNLWTVPVGNWRSHTYRLLPAIAIKEGAEGCQQRHVERHPFATAERPQTFGQVLINSEAEGSTIAALDSRAR